MLSDMHGSRVTGWKQLYITERKIQASFRLSAKKGLASIIMKKQLMTYAQRATPLPDRRLDSHIGPTDLYGLPAQRIGKDHDHRGS